MSYGHYSTHVECELSRAVKMTTKDHRQRWVTMDGAIHVEPVPYRDAVSVTWMPIHRMACYAFRAKINPRCRWVA